LLLLSLCLLLSAVALNVYMVWYNYLNFRFGWGPLRIGAFFSVFGLCIALVQGLAIRAMVPGLLTENQGVVFGSLLQVGSGCGGWAGEEGLGYLFLAACLAVIIC
ncbi:unnamed protein product, partial [Discosporangium mesarthrocarpum]